MTLHSVHFGRAYHGKHLVLIFSFLSKQFYLIITAYTSSSICLCITNTYHILPMAMSILGIRSMNFLDISNHW